MNVRSCDLLTVTAEADGMEAAAPAARALTVGAAAEAAADAMV